MKNKHPKLFCRECGENCTATFQSTCWGIDNGATRNFPHEVTNFLERNNRVACSYCIDRILYGAGRNLVGKSEWGISFRTKLFVENTLKYHFSEIKEEEK